MPSTHILVPKREAIDAVFLDSGFEVLGEQLALLVEVVGRSLMGVG